MQIALLLFLVQVQHIVGGINLKDATHSRFPRRYHQSRILKLHPLWVQSILLSTISNLQLFDSVLLGITVLLD
ncbi:hypothetical protein [Nostoc sp. UHCC 0252]|uniref:hypothetical protein n=1 Tax=Nostoc sp. UHCC 0252 TaxID=3110241 RepID=UPI002B1FF5AB|nr:hypothetical protein [Nostoc sp. UHCC 0252]MEA5604675.1 hypothetical protein [Nostoc sp. UHCC 0252]